MERRTFDFGIDLGTTNSSIAKLEGIKPRVIEIEGFKVTPSVIWVTPKGAVYVGNRAKQRESEGDDNLAKEFKLSMGTDYVKKFKIKDQVITMTPEQLSAEVLKFLKAEAEMTLREKIQAAVITVPAHFGTEQCKATKEAAKFAGFERCELLQEPTAAGIAYGGLEEKDNVFWLVYDFGGGTFDINVIRIAEGLIKTIAHGGDNQLGGKYIDEDIVNKIVVPEVIKEYKPKDFNPQNPRYKKAFVKLKYWAEKAKINLSSREKTEIYIDELCEEIPEVYIELTRKDIEPLIEPYVYRTINICKKVIKEAGLSPEDIEKLILIGGPTYTPILQEMLREELKIPLAFDIDPMTAVAQGAAMFAGSLKLDIATDISRIKTGAFVVDLKYDAVVNDLEPIVGGKVISKEANDLKGYTIEFVETKTLWRSGKEELKEDGTFITSLRIEKGRENWFNIVLYDSKGNICQISPDKLGPIRYYPQRVDKPILPRSIGVELYDGRMEILLEKGKSLPVKKIKTFQTAIDIKVGQTNLSLLRIPIYEGENKLCARHNKRLGDIIITPERIIRDVPVGSEIRVTLEMDESRVLKAEAFVPILDEFFEEVIKPDRAIPDVKELSFAFQNVKKRFESLKQQHNEFDISEVSEIFRDIEKENLLEQISETLKIAESDPAIAERCNGLILDLESRLDQVEEYFEWPREVKSTERILEDYEKMVQDYGNLQDKEQFKKYKEQIEFAISGKDRDLLKKRMEELDDFIRERIPIIWVIYFNILIKEIHKMKDKVKAEKLRQEGLKAIENNDLSKLRRVVIELVKLLPKLPEEIPSFII